VRWREYPRYKPSGVEWLEKVPEQWELKPLKRIFITLNGSTPKSSEPDYWDGDIPWATPDDLGNLIGDTLQKTRRMITQKGYKSCGTSLAPAGSLVLSTRAPIGHLAIAGVPMCTNQGCRCLVFLGKAENRFYYYQLLAAKQELESWGKGSTFKELNRDRLTSIYLASPHPNEQSAIAVFLERETGRIDALIE
jgi:type I restriction enzyme S subunit